MRHSLIWVISAVVLLGATALRCREITVRSIWFDEAFSWTLVSQFGLTNVVERTAQDVHPPFYYLVLWLWIHVFGDSLLVMRSMSVLFGMSSVIVAFFLGKSAAPSNADNRKPSNGTSLGVSFAILVGASPFQIHWSGEIRMYSLLTLLFLTSTLLGLLAMQRKNFRRWYWAGYSFTAAAMLYTHNYGVFSFIAQAVFFLAATYFCRTIQSASGEAPVFRECFSALTIASLLYLPWIPTLLRQRSQVAADYWIGSFSLRQLSIAWDGVVFPENGFQPWQIQRGTVTLAATLIVLLCLQIRGRIVDRLCLLLTALPITVAVLISVTSTSIIADRLFVLAHVGALFSFARATQKWLEPVPGMLLTIVIAANFLNMHFQYRSQLNVSTRSGARGAVEWIESHVEPDEKVYVLHPCIYFSMRYHAANRHRFVLCTTPQNISHYTGAPLLQRDERLDFIEIERILSPRLWVIDSDGFSAGYSKPLIRQPWQWKSEKKFPGPNFFERDVVVTKYVRNIVSDRNEAE